MDNKELKHYSFQCGYYVNQHGFKVENGYLYIKRIGQDPFIKIELTEEIVKELEAIRHYTFADDAIRTYKVFVLAWLYSPIDENGKKVIGW